MVWIGNKLRTLPSHIPPDRRGKLYGVRPASHVPTPPPRVLSVQRWVGPSGTVSVAGQRLSLGLANVGRLITVVIEGHQFRVFAERGHRCRQSLADPAHPASRR